MDKKGIVFFDVDGTLVDYTLSFTPQTVYAIKQLKENGYYVVVNTTAPEFMIYPEILSANFDAFISSTGTKIKFNGECIYEKKIDPQLVYQTISLLTQHSIKNLMSNDREIFEYKNTDFFQDLLFDVTSVENLETFTKINDINKLEYFIKSWSEVQPFIEFFKANFNLLIHHQNAYGELLPKGISKGSSLKWLCDYLKIDIKNSYAFGDGFNDFDMLKCAGHSIAMGNSNTKLKEIADFVTKPVDENGVVFALEHFKLI